MPQHGYACHGVHVEALTRGCFGDASILTLPPARGWTWLRWIPPARRPPKRLWPPAPPPTPCVAARASSPTGRSGCRAYGQAFGEAPLPATVAPSVPPPSPAITWRAWCNDGRHSRVLRAIGPSTVCVRALSPSGPARRAARRDDGDDRTPRRGHRDGLFSGR